MTKKLKGRQKKTKGRQKKHGGKTPKKCGEDPKKNSTGADHVLENFSTDEKGNVEKVTQNIIESLSILINKDLDLFSSKINQQQ